MCADRRNTVADLIRAGHAAQWDAGASVKADQDRIGGWRLIWNCLKPDVLDHGAGTFMDSGDTDVAGER